MGNETPQEFDPYHRWLGIPPEEQPANHYRLLGLVQLESDVEVIRDGAERQIGHVRRYGLGKHSDLSQRILNELAAAKACLLDPEKKSRYDAQLRKKLEASKPKPALEPKKEAREVSKATGLPPPSPAPPELPSSQVNALPIGVMERTPVSALGGNVLKLVAVGGGAAVGLLVVVSLALYFVWRGTGDGKGPASPAPGVPSSGPSQVVTGPASPPQPRPPKLARIPDTPAEEGQLLTIQVEVADRGTARGPLLFRLTQTPPQGATIDPEKGVFQWTPSREQAGRKHPVTVQVAPRDAPALSHEVAFLVNVQQAMLRPPRLEAIPEQEVEAGRRRVFFVVAHDTNRPPRKIVYALSGAPPWVSINAGSGAVTLAPPEDDQGGPRRVLVRVSSDAPDAPYVEEPLAFVVTPRSMPPEKPPPTPPEKPDLSGLVEVKGLSGPLDPAQMDVRQTAMATAQNLMERAEGDPRVMPLFAGPAGGPVAAVCQLNKSNKLDGWVIAFQPGKDPLSCLDAKTRAIAAAMPKPSTRRFMVPNTLPGMVPSVPGTIPGGQVRGVPGRPAEESDMNEALDAMGSLGLNSMQMANARQQALQTFWADVRLNGCVQFKQGDRHGVAATWDVQGQRLYWGNYDRGKRHDFCALFENDQPRIVAVFEQGKAGTVYLLSNNRVQKTFADEEEARRDPTAQPLLDKLNEIDARVKSDERKMEKQIKATIQFRVGNLNQYKNLMSQMRMAGRAAQQMQGIQRSQRKAITGQ